MISPKARRMYALVTVCLVIGLHVAAFFGLIAETEPPWVLHLSFGALELSAIDILATTDVRVKEQEEKEG